MNMQPTTLDAYQLLHEGILALAHVERCGVYVDVEYCENMIQHLERQSIRCENNFKKSDLVKLWKNVYRQATNLQSPAQLADILYNHMKLEPVKFTKKDNPSVDEEALQALDVPELQELLEGKNYKHLSDVLKGFTREQVNGVIHPIFNLNMARSFRPSTEAPNMANVPKRDPVAQKICREAIKPRPGHKIVSADFKGVEVSVAACYHKDPDMITYVSDSSKDMHRDMALELFKLELADICTLKDGHWELEKISKAIRQTSKNSFVFPQFYGDWYKQCAGYMWPQTFLDTHKLKNGILLHEHLKSHGLGTLEKFIDHVKMVEDWMWEEKWPQYTAWKKQWVKDYYANGYFDTLTGFRCSGVMDRKQATNYPVQGSAFHCLLQCLIWMVRDSIEEGWDSFVCNQIYDDLMLDVHPSEEKMVVERLRYYMTEKLPQTWKWLIVPLEVDIEATPIDGSWYEKSHKHLAA